VISRQHDASTAADHAGGIVCRLRWRVVMARLPKAGRATPCLAADRGPGAAPGVAHALAVELSLIPYGWGGRHRAAEVDRVIVRHFFHIDSLHLVTRLEPVAVARLIVCAVLAASRVYAADAATVNNSTPGSLDAAARGAALGTYATAPECDGRCLRHRLGTGDTSPGAVDRGIELL
jgi:hypothetical protein